MTYSILSVARPVFASICLTLCLLPPAVWAQEPSANATDVTGTASALPDMAEIEAAWARQDFVFVRQGLQKLAEDTGLALAQYRYGRVLLEGRGGPVDVPAAVDWLSRAEAQNHLDAGPLLARLYLSAVPGGPARDPAKAAALFARAAARGHAEAQYYLGLLYRAGTGVETDPAQSFNWLLAASEGGYVAAQYELSKAYSRGEGTELNTAQALRWLQQAAEGGHSEAQFFLALALDNGQGVSQDQAAALSWFHRAAEGGYLLAQRGLGQRYLTGSGVAPNLTEALRWLRRAAGAGDVISVYLLGLALLETQEGADRTEAARLLQSAMEEGYAPAATALGQMQEAEDLALAVQFYRRAVELGDPMAELRLGRLVAAGQIDGLAPPHYAVPWAMRAASEGVDGAIEWVQAQADAGLRPAQQAYGLWLLDEETDPNRAFPYLEAAAERGAVRAQHRVGVILAQGSAGVQDYVAAHTWLNIAATSGHDEAARMRAVITDLMTPEDLAAAHRAARAFFASAGDRVPGGTGGDHVPVGAGRDHVPGGTGE